MRVVRRPQNHYDKASFKSTRRLPLSRKRSRNTKQSRQSRYEDDDAPPHGRSRRKATQQPPTRRVNLLPITPQTRGQEDLIEAIATSDITVCDGPAGSGKSLISFGSALHYRESDHHIKRIVVVRPILPAGDDDEIGYLPGGVDEKLGPYTAPLFRDAASLLIECEDRLSTQEYNEMVKEYLASLDVEVIPLSMLRGRSLNNSFIILDEAQNCTKSDFKLFLTRIGKNSRVVIEGDSTQSDRDDGYLTQLQGTLAEMKRVSIVKLGSVDIVRSPLIAEILRRFSD